MAEKIAVHKYDSLPAVRLYKEELEEIFALLQEISKSVDIKTAGMKYESPEDFFTENKDKVSVDGLGITGWKEAGAGYIRVTFYDNLVEVSTNDQSGMARAAYGRIKEILKNNRVKASFLLNSTIGIWVSSFILVTAACFITYAVFSAGLKFVLEADVFSSAADFAVLCVFVFFALLFLGHYIFSKVMVPLGKTNICPAPRSQQKNFWARYQDKIIFEGIKAIFTLAVGFALAQLFN